MADRSARWTPDEILAELRRRERAGAGGARALKPPREPRAQSLASVATPKLTAALKAGQRAIYGVDDRKEAFEIPASARQLAAASVALVQASDLRRSSGGWRLATTSFKEEYELCPQEKFGSQPLGCFCSGVLVAPDVIATAGHCIEKAADLATTRFVFGFRMLDRKKARTTFPDDDVYTGTKILGRRLSEDGTDWAVIRLDRPVVGRKPVKFRSSGKVSDTEPLFVIGHPCGLPQKYAAGATVQQNSRRVYFVANLDTYGGNSGSPVFGARSRTLEGLLVRGQTDFVKVGSCHVSQVFPTTGAGGEDVTRSTVWSKVVGAKGRKQAANGARAGGKRSQRTRKS